MSKAFTEDDGSLIFLTYHCMVHLTVNSLYKTAKFNYHHPVCLYQLMTVKIILIKSDHSRTQASSFNPNTVNRAQRTNQAKNVIQLHAVRLTYTGRLA